MAVVAALVPNHRQASLNEPSHMVSVSASTDEVEERVHKTSMGMSDRKHLWALHDSYLDRRGSMVRSYHKLDSTSATLHPKAVSPNAGGSYANWLRILAQRGLAWFTHSLERYTGVRL